MSKKKQKKPIKVYPPLPPKLIFDKKPAATAGTPYESGDIVPGNTTTMKNE